VSSRNLGTLTSWNPLGHPRPVMGLLYHFYSLLGNSTPSAQKIPQSLCNPKSTQVKKKKTATGPYPVPEESTPPLHTYLSRLFITLCRSQWPGGLRRGSTAARLLGLWVRIPPGHGCLSVLSAVCCCQVEVSATG